MNLSMTKGKSKFLVQKPEADSSIFHVGHKGPGKANDKEELKK